MVGRGEEGSGFSRNEKPGFCKKPGFMRLIFEKTAWARATGSQDWQRQHHTKVNDRTDHFADPVALGPCLET